MSATPAASTVDTMEAEDKVQSALAHTDIAVRDADSRDAASVALIYNHYVVRTTATFETQIVHPAVMADRIKQCQHAGLPWLLAVQDGSVLGYAYAVPWKPRQAYRRSCETTIYLDPDQVGRGIGKRLYKVLLDRLRDGGCHTAIGGIALPNPASVALHEALGFEKTAHFRQVGYKHGRWVDVGYWQTLLGPQAPDIAKPRKGWP
jgi:phosphinothricin acetyltransferase